MYIVMNRTVMVNYAVTMHVAVYVAMHIAVHIMVDIDVIMMMIAIRRRHTASKGQYRQQHQAKQQKPFHGKLLSLGLLEGKTPP
ncbi:MAG: hypothetical protein K6G15_01450 [Desulfovibrio sp.]|nr:hypothetical protein [Desulfovibrio sp.]